MKLGDMTPAQQAAAIRKATGDFQKELDAAVPALEALLEEEEVNRDNREASAQQKLMHEYFIPKPIRTVAENAARIRNADMMHTNVWF